MVEQPQPGEGRGPGGLALRVGDGGRGDEERRAPARYALALLMETPQREPFSMDSSRRTCRVESRSSIEPPFLEGRRRRRQLQRRQQGVRVWRRRVPECGDSCAARRPSFGSSSLTGRVGHNALLLRLGPSCNFGPGMFGPRVRVC